MNITEAINQRKRRSVVEVPIDLPDIDRVRVRKVTTGELLDAAKAGDHDGGLMLVKAAIVDDDDKPAFASVAEIRALDWDLTHALIDAANAVNGLSRAVEDAAKN